MDYVGTETRYVVVCAEEAELRADRVLETVGLDTDVRLDDRLTAVLEHWWVGEAPARALANETRHLYQLLTHPARDQPDKPVDPRVLRRCLIMAMTRPAGDPCWRDYEALNGVIAKYHRSTHVGVLAGALRKLTGRGPDKARVEAGVQPLIEARKRFVATWRTSA